MKRKSLFLLGNAILLIPTMKNPEALATTIEKMVEPTPLSGPEIVEGIVLIEDVLTAEADRNGQDTPLYDALSELQTTLHNKAMVAEIDIDDYRTRRPSGDIGATSFMKDADVTGRSKQPNGAVHADA